MSESNRDQDSFKLSLILSIGSLPVFGIWNFPFIFRTFKCMKAIPEFTSSKVIVLTKFIAKKANDPLC
jgi:hypothetical protein